MFKPLKSIAIFALSTALLGGVAHADITVYTAGPQNLIDKLSAGFTAQTGIKVNVFQATTGKVMARIEAEAANPAVDVLISASWRVLYEAQQQGRLATSGPYAYVRHPQYVGFVLVMAGFLVQWPTLLTLAMFPILVGMYVRLSFTEEREARREFYEAYDRYAQGYSGYEA